MREQNWGCPADHEELHLPFDLGGNRPFFQNEQPADRIFVRFFGHRKTQNLTGYVAFGPLMEGPPKHAHGGAIAYVMDEIMGTTAWNHGIPVVAEKIDVEYLDLVALREVLVIEARVTRKAKKRVAISATLKDQEGRTLSRSKGLFHILTDEQIGRFKKLIGSRDK